MTGKAQAHAYYAGDRTKDLVVGMQAGPTTYGALMYVVDWAYDPATDRTRIGFSAVKPVEAS